MYMKQRLQLKMKFVLDVFILLFSSGQGTFGGTSMKNLLGLSPWWLGNEQIFYYWGIALSPLFIPVEKTLVCAPLSKKNL